MEKVIKCVCSACGKPQQVVVRGDKIYGKARTCVYCEKRFTLTKNNVVLLIKY
jgi:hypothetical protein